MDLIGPQPRGVRLGENAGNGVEVVTPVVTTPQEPFQDPQLAQLAAAWPALHPDARAALMAALDGFRNERTS